MPRCPETDENGLDVKRDYYRLILPAILVVLLDQITKYMVTVSIGIYEKITIINGFFNLVHVRNRGMAFGLLNRSETGLPYYILVIATLMAIVLLLFWFTRLKQEEKGISIGLSLIIGGATGNLIDRLRLTEVIDFLDFHVGSHHWPSFNLADSCITIGTIWVVTYILFFGTKEEKN